MSGGSNMLVGAPILTNQQTVQGAADKIVGQHPLAGGASRNVGDNPSLTLALMVLASVGILAGLQLAGFRSTIAIGRS